MSIRITFQGPHFGEDEHSPYFRAKPRGSGYRPYPYENLSVQVQGVDLDYGAFTITLNDEDGDNLTLAEVYGPYVNEEGVETRALAWEIKPDEDLLKRLTARQREQLARVTGLVYGRPIITAEGDDVAVNRDPADIDLRVEVKS